MSENSSAKKSRLDRILDAIERAGNKLPDPITMFLGLAIIVTIISAICSAAGVSAVNPADGSTIEVFNLLSLDGIRYLWTNVITNFSGFAPLGMVLVAVIGSSVAEKSGFLVAVMVNFLGKAKGWIVTMVIMFLGINLNIAGDAGFIVLPCSDPVQVHRTSSASRNVHRIRIGCSRFLCEHSSRSFRCTCIRIHRAGSTDDRSELSAVHRDQLVFPDRLLRTSYDRGYDPG